MQLSNQFIINAILMSPTIRNLLKKLNTDLWIEQKVFFCEKPLSKTAFKSKLNLRSILINLLFPPHLNRDEAWIAFFFYFWAVYYDRSIAINIAFQSHYLNTDSNLKQIHWCITIAGKKFTHNHMNKDRSFRSLTCASLRFSEFPLFSLCDV